MKISEESSVLAAMANFKQAILAGDVAELARIWTEDYTIINPQGGIDMAVVQNLSTLHGHFSGVQTDTDLRGMFVWVHRDGRWRLVTDQLTPVVR